MDNIRTIDIEDALQNALNNAGITASAPPVPANLEPCVYVHRTGGYGLNYVQDLHTIDFDTYETTEAASMQTACELTEWVRALAGKSLGVPVYIAEITTLPYYNPDPNHPSLKRTTFSAQIPTRVEH